MSENVLLMHLWPYQNSWIINVIQDMFFTGGAKSFASCFESDFPTFNRLDGVTVQEVLVSMVVLVSTAVCGSWV